MGILGAIGGIASAIGAGKSLFGGGGTTTSRKVAPPTAEELDLIRSIMGGIQQQAPSKQTATVSKKEVDAEVARRQGSSASEFLTGLGDPEIQGKRYTAKQLGDLVSGTPRPQGYTAQDVIAMYKRKYGGSKVDRGAVEQELKAARQAELDKQYEEAVKKQQEEQTKLQESLAPDTQIQDLFKTRLTEYLAKKPDGTLDPAALESATSFVDQTFTRPAEEQLRMAQSDYASQLGAQQAALGRGGMDSTFQANLFGSLAKQRADLGAMRGQAIGQMAQDLQFNQPIRQLQAGLGGLGGISQIQSQNAFAPSFLNQLNQQAMQNRLALLNNLSNTRTGNVSQTTTGPSGGLLADINAGMQAGSQFGSNIASSFKDISNYFQPSTSQAPSGRVTNAYFMPAGSSGRMPRE